MSIISTMMIRGSENGRGYDIRSLHTAAHHLKKTKDLPIHYFHVRLPTHDRSDGPIWTNGTVKMDYLEFLF